jgi:hypothetical protein
LIIIPNNLRNIDTSKGGDEMRSNTAYFLIFYFQGKKRKFTPIQLEEQNKLQKNFISYIPTILPKLPLHKQ